MRFNDNLLNLENSDSFYKATARIREYKQSHPNHKVVSLGIGDVSFPVCKTIKQRMIEAVEKEATNDYVGYGNYYGIPELRKAIRDNEYPNFSIDEIYVSHGTKSDCGDILEMFTDSILVGIPNPTYPIYKNTCISLNKKFEEIECDENFVPVVPNKHFDVVYLCSPNNPVGVSYTYDQLKKWVEYAQKENCVIIYDNVYFKFIKQGIKSIYEIDGAEKCAIEMRSFSKHASFTGIRCSYYVVPNKLGEEINKYWKLRTINRFNGASYIAQVGALASYEKEACEEINKNIEYYQENANILRKSLLELGYKVYGGENAPYMWCECKNNITGWETFELFLTQLEVVVVPGSIFGNIGEKYFRVSALGKREEVLEAVERIRKYEQTK